MAAIEMNTLLGERDNALPKDRDDKSSQEALIKPPVRERLASRWGSLALDTWFYEFLALSFSVACFIVIFVILRVYDGKATPKLSHGLTLNTIVSVLSTASKSSLIFVVGESIGQLRWTWFKKGARPLSQFQTYDSASRGPWGSWCMLFQDRGRSLVSIGAVVTILALAFDPFVQQILTYPVRQRWSHSDAATIKQSHFILPGDNNPDFIDAINVGFWADDFPMNPICPSGNCTWAPFRSVEICSKCEDVTASAGLNGCTDAPFNVSLLKNQPTACNVTLPEGAWSAYEVSIEPYGHQDNISYFSMYLPEDVIWEVDVLTGDVKDSPAGEVFFPGEDYEDNVILPNKTFLDVTNPLLVIAHAVLDIPKANTDNRINSHPEHGLHIRQVTECVISLCARTYNVSVSDGVPTVVVLDTDWGSFFTRKYNLNNFLTDGICWKPGTGSAETSTDTNFANTTEFAFCPAQMLWGSALESALRGKLTRRFDYDTWHSSWGDSGSDGVSSETTRKLIKSGLDKVVPNIAASLTKFARDASNLSATGTMAHSESYVAVEWAWLALPAILLVMGIVLLVSTALSETSRRLGLWKSSVLPVLYHGVDGDLIEPGSHGSMSEMERAATGVGVKLDYSDPHGRLMLRGEGKE